MRITSTSNINNKQGNLSVLKIKPQIVNVYSKQIEKTAFSYYSYIAFKGNKAADLSLVRDIIESLNSDSTPVLQKQYEDSVDVNYNPDFSIEDSEFNDILRKRKDCFIDEFNRNSEDLYNSPDSTKADKMRAVQFAYSFVADKAKSYKEPQRLGDYLNSLNLSLENRHTVFADNSIQNLFSDAREYWEQEYLPILLQKEEAHLVFVQKAIERMPLLKELKSFNDLSVEDKFFVAKYYEVNDFRIFKDDPMTKILSDHTIKNKEDLLSEIRQKIIIDTEIFLEKLTQIPEMILEKTGIDELSDTIIKGKNKDNEISLLNLFVDVLDKKDLYGQNNDTLLKYFNTLNQADLNKAIKDLKKLWFNKYIPLRLENEITYQAYKTDIHVRNNDELRKINKQLEQINIKLDKISISLTEYISNLDGVCAKFKNPVEDSIAIQRNTGMKIEEMLSSAGKLSCEEQEKLMSAFREDGSRYLDILLNNTKDLAVKNMINDMKTVIKEENRPNAVITRLEGYATMAVMSNLMHNSCHVASAGAAHAANAAAGASASAGGFLASVLNPQALALAAVVTGLYSIYSATQTHKSYSDMYFGGKM